MQNKEWKCKKRNMVQERDKVKRKIKKIKIPRHTARIYAISINSVHRGALYCERSEQYRDSQC